MNIEITCIECKKVYPITCEEKDYKAWKEGAYIQNALPYLSDDERELLLSGICGDCFNDLFGVNEFEDKEFGRELLEEIETIQREMFN